MAGIDGITVKGAREHNLKNIDVHIPRNKITVITGLSGSGKSSLAFDTIYAEGQRRYVESLSAYARSFLEQLKKPEVDSIIGLSPAIAIEQKNTSTNPRSTVGTVTEVYDFLRLLFARAGTAHCPNCKIPVASQTPDHIISEIASLKSGTKFHLLAPMAKNKKGEFHNQFEQWARQGFIRAKVDGDYLELANAKKLKKTVEHNIDLLIDRLVIKPDLEKRLAESVHVAIRMSGGWVSLELENGDIVTYSIHSACKKCGFNFPEIEPRFFSFNNPRGACATCNGLGVLEDENAVAQEDPEDDESFEVPVKTCPDCNGLRLRQESLHVLVAKKNIAETSTYSVDQLLSFLGDLKWEEKTKLIVDKILEQIFSRLNYMSQVGVGYLSMSRPVRTLSGGEAQRVRLATQIGSSLIGILYVLDEPSIGLHPRDHQRLLKTLISLKDHGNTILLVEHDEDTIRTADYIIDLGPRAGALGGNIISEGSLDFILKDQNSLTAKYLNKSLSVPFFKNRRSTKANQFLTIRGACGNNLKSVDMSLPLGTLTAVTGVSGSGKSTLIVDTLYKALSRHFYKNPNEPAAYKKIEGLDFVDKIVEINQKPIGRTPRSNPSTYVGLFSMIRNLFSQHPEAKIRGYTPGRFSFNIKGGRCENCQGAGAVRIEMHFMADVHVNCDVCLGKRYNRETLNIKYKEKSIADILDMSVEEALSFFEHHELIYRKLDTLHRVGLDYIKLGQSSTTLSGGEAQRVKLSRELSKRGSGKTIYILDEPTTGLHFHDVHKLVELLHELVDQGNTVVVIEHNLDVIRSADHIIDLGPDGGHKGGEIVAAGTPEVVAKNPASATGLFLKKVLK